MESLNTDVMLRSCRFTTLCLYLVELKGDKFQGVLVIFCGVESCLMTSIIYAILDIARLYFYDVAIVILPM